VEEVAARQPAFVSGAAPCFECCRPTAALASWAAASHATPAAGGRRPADTEWRTPMPAHETDRKILKSAQQGPVRLPGCKVCIV
jgi:hypothetical protein